MSDTRLGAETAPIVINRNIMQTEHHLVAPPTGIVVISDLHAEAQLKRAKRAIDGLPDAKILILAGDIGNYHDGSLRSILCHGSSQYANVIYVPGNHDYYGLSGSLDHSDDLLTALATDCGCTMLQEQVVELEGYTIAGTTLWTDVNKAPGSEIQYMCDYSAIKGLTPFVISAVHRRQANWLRELVADPETCPDVIVTHHVPCFDTRLLNRNYTEESKHLFHVPGFAEEIEKLAAKCIKLWAWGHSHVRGAIQLDSILLFANCLGNQYGDRLYSLPTGSVGLKNVIAE